MKNKKLKILIGAAELNPIAKAGGLGDVVGALPKVLIDLNCDVKAILPFYGFIDTKKYKTVLVKKNISIKYGERNEKVDLWETEINNFKVFLIKNRFFSSKEIYSGERVLLNGKYTRNFTDIEKFAFFSIALLECLKAIDWRPDVIHCNDWHLGLVPRLLKEKYASDNFFLNTKTLYTIHNLANQGITDSSILKNLGIARIDKVKVNLMSEGISSSDLINTVSPSYAKEILKKDQGAGLDKILLKREADLSGIINGIDIDFFNPDTDRFIKQYSLKNIENKQLNKLVLQKMVGLEQNKSAPLIGLISRFVNQKGINLITDKFKNLDCQFIFLGTGQKDIENQLLTLSSKFPHKFSAQIKFDVGLAQQIYAGSDIFLMPSLFEPCGLGQMIAMRYGTVPVVRATGGLIDTVDSQVGFSFKKYDSNVLYETLKKAIEVYHKRPNDWKKLQANGMKKDFSWNKSAKEYIKLYNKLANIK